MYCETLVFETKGKSNYRIPSIVVDKRGTVFAFCNDRIDSRKDHAAEQLLVCARKKPGMDWEPVQVLVHTPEWRCLIGSAVYDEIEDVVMCSVLRNPVAQDEFGEFTQEELDKIEQETQRREKEAGIKRGQYMVYTTDGGENWQERPLVIKPAEFTHWDGTKVKKDGHCHGSSAGIQLRHGLYKGRLLCPSRTTVGQYTDWEQLRKCVYNNAIYSDDHGLTWKASTPVQLGTGEGTLIECADGSITYNSRAYFQDQKRYLATSIDGGASYGEFRTDDFLIEEIKQGCNAGFLRVEREDIKDTSLLPEDADGITVFTNPRSDTRRNMTVCISFDSGKSWSKTKTVYEGPCAYSSICFSKEDQHFYLMYENGIQTKYDKGITVAEFDLEWLLG